MNLNHSEIMERYALVRKDKGLSFRKLADILGISYGVIQNIEHKRVEKVSNTYINLLCDKLNVNKDWLLFGEGEMYNLSSPEDLELMELFGGMIKDTDPAVRDLMLVANKLSDENLEKLLNIAMDYLELEQLKSIKKKKSE